MIFGFKIWTREYSSAVKLLLSTYEVLGSVPRIAKIKHRSLHKLVILLSNTENPNRLS